MIRVIVIAITMLILIFACLEKTKANKKDIDLLFKESSHLSKLDSIDIKISKLQASIDSIHRTNKIILPNFIGANDGK